MVLALATQGTGTHANAQALPLPQRTTILVAATTDVHGRVRGWNYDDDRPDSTRGLSRAATIIDSLRRAHPGHVVLVDAGDMLQGNALTLVAARDRSVRPHPVMAAMNAMDYDAAVVGNHDFDYGVAFLRRIERQAGFPLLGANVRKPDGNAALPASRMVTKGGVSIGIVGATTPGAMIWDRDQLEGRLVVTDIVPAIRRETAGLRARGASVVVVVLHSGLGEPSGYDTSAAASENVAARVAREVDGIDLLVYGHSHAESAGRTIGSTLLVQPRPLAGSVAVATLSLERSGKHWRVGESRGQVVPTTGWAESPSVLAVSARAHEAARTYVATPVARTLTSWSAESSRVRDTPLIDFVLDVMRRQAHADLAATPSYDVGLRLDSGAVSMAQLTRLYPYENTLRAVRISGAQLRAYLEHSARYYAAATTSGRVGAVDPKVPGYNFDILAGVDYTLDLARPIGSRVIRLEFRGHPVAPTDSFTIALNSYRQAGGGGYSMLHGAPVVYDRQQDMRQLLIDAARRRGTLDLATSFQQNWFLEPPPAATLAHREPGGQGTRQRLRILAINDFHGALEARTDSGGTARGGAVALAAEIARARAECLAPACQSLLLDGGDEFQGTPASNLAFGRPVVALFNYLGVRAAAVGNHEFDWGQDTLRARMADAHYPFLAANVRYADGRDVPWIADDTLLTVGNWHVGVIGLATVATGQITKAATVADLRFVEAAGIVDAQARALRARGANAVVVVAHAGAFCRATCDGEIVDLAMHTTEHIDAVVSGHTHSPVNTVVRGTAIVQARTRGTTLGVIDLSATGATPHIELRDVLASQVTTPDDSVVAIVRGATQALAARLQQPIATVGEFLSSRRDGALGNLIADAQRAAGRGDVAVMNAGGVRSSLSPGTVTFGSLFEVQPFGNELVRFTLSGRSLRQYLERLVAKAPAVFLSGAEVRYDSTRTAGARIVDVRLSNGRTLDDSAQYALVMSDFLADGGDGLNLDSPAIKRENMRIVDLDALIDYLRSQPGPIHGPRDRRLIPVSP